MDKYRAALNSTKDEWTWSGSGPWWKRLRIRLFGLTSAEQDANARIWVETRAHLLAESEREDREFDEWWEQEGKWAHWPWNCAATTHHCWTSACDCGVEAVL